MMEGLNESLSQKNNNLVLTTPTYHSRLFSSIRQLSVRNAPHIAAYFFCPRTAAHPARRFRPYFHVCATNEIHLIYNGRQLVMK